MLTQKSKVQKQNLSIKSVNSFFGEEKAQCTTVCGLAGRVTNAVE